MAISSKDMISEYEKNIKLNLEKLILSKYPSIRNFSKACGISQQTIDSIINNRQHMSFTHFGRMMEYLDWDYEAIFGDIGIKPQPKEYREYRELLEDMGNPQIREAVLAEYQKAKLYFKRKKTEIAEPTFDEVKAEIERNPEFKKLCLEVYNRRHPDRKKNFPHSP